MKKRIITTGVLIVYLLCLCSMMLGCQKGGNDMEIKCMTFNILGIDGYDGYLPVNQRAQHMQKYLNESGMDLIGMQEAGSHDYDWQSFFVQKIERDGVYKAVTIGAEKAYDEQASRYPAGRVSNSAGLIILYKADRWRPAARDILPPNCRNATISGQSSWIRRVARLW